MAEPEKSRRKRESNLRSAVLEADALTTRPTRWWEGRRAITGLGWEEKGKRSGEREEEKRRRREENVLRIGGGKEERKEELID